jgi:hypothetical protein
MLLDTGNFGQRGNNEQRQKRKYKTAIYLSSIHTRKVPIVLKLTSFGN